MNEKLLLIIAYQLSCKKTNSGRIICPWCHFIGIHSSDCELGKAEKWVEDELLTLWRESFDVQI